MKKQIPTKHKDAMVAAYLSGASLKAAASEFGYSVSVIYDELERRGIERRPAIQEKFRQARSPSTDEQKGMAAAYLAGDSTKEASRRYGFSADACRAALKRQGISLRKDKSKISKEQKDAMITAYLTGTTGSEAGALFGYSGKPVFRELKARGLSAKPAIRRDATSPESKRQIISDYSSGLGMKEVATQSGKSQTTIQGILAKHRVPRRRSTGRLSTVTEPQKSAMVEAYLSGESAIIAAAKFGFHEWICRAALKERGLQCRPLGKLTPEKRAEICARSQENPRALAIEFGLNHGNTIGSILSRAGVKGRSKSEAIRRYGCNHDFFESVDSEEKAYWLGFLAADGCVSEKFSVVALHLQEKDSEHLKRFARALQSEHPVKCRSNGKYRSASIKIASQKLASGLACFGVAPRKTFTLEWPSKLPEALQRHFLRGYFDGDGSWSTPKNSQSDLLSLRFSMVGNEEFITGARAFLAQQCALPLAKLSRQDSTKVVSLTYGGNRQSARIAHLLYHGASVYLPRKLEKARPFLSSETLPE